MRFTHNQSRLLALSVALCSLTLTLSAHAVGDDCNYRPNTIDSTSRSAAEALERASLQGCAVSELSSECQAWFKENPETSRYAACKNQQIITYADLASSCAKSIGGAWTEGLQEIARGALKDVKTAGQATAHAISEIPNAPQAIDDCDKKIECKRQLALEANFNFKTDADLEEVYAGDLMRKRESLRALVGHDSKVRTIVDDQQSSIDAREKEGRYEHGMAKAFNAQSRQTVFPTISEIAKKQLLDLQVKYQCYDTAGQAHLWCYAFGTVVDPTIIAGGVLKGFKAGKWAGAVLNAQNLVPESISKLRSRVSDLNIGSVRKLSNPKWTLTSFEAPSKIIIYDSSGLKLNQSISTSKSYTAMIRNGQMILGEDLVGVTGKIGGPGTHIHLMGADFLATNEKSREGLIGFGGSVRFNSDGSIDISGYHAKTKSLAAAQALRDILKESFPTSQMRITEDRLTTLPPR